MQLLGLDLFASDRVRLLKHPARSALLVRALAGVHGRPLSHPRWLDCPKCSRSPAKIDWGSIGQVPLSEPTYTAEVSLDLVW